MTERSSVTGIREWLWIRGLTITITACPVPPPLSVGGSDSWSDFILPLSKENERGHHPDQHQAQPNQELCPRVRDEEWSTGRRPTQWCVSDPPVGASRREDPSPKPVQGKGEPSDDDDPLSGI